MGFSDIPAETDPERILSALDLLDEKFDRQNARLDSHAEAINGIGMNIQWLVDNAKHLFEMFGNPQFMKMLPQMMNPAGMMDAAKQMGVDNGGGHADADRSEAAV